MDKRVRSDRNPSTGDVVNAMRELPTEMQKDVLEFIKKISNKRNKKTTF